MIGLGVAKADITPSRPVPLAGFAHRKSPSRGVARRLFARTLLFRTGPRHRALLVSADLIWWGPEIVERLRRRLFERFGLPAGSVILHATHTHSGPQTTARLSPLLGAPDPTYLDELEDTIVQTVASATEAVEPVTVERGSGRCNIGVNRRRERGGRIVMAPNRKGPVDPEVTVARLNGVSGRTRAVLVHHACHPTTTDDNLLSSEFPGSMADSLERRLGEGAVVLYLQGCCGDVRPALVRNGEFFRGDAGDVDRLGETLAGEVTSVLEGPMTALPPIRLAARSARVPLPLQKTSGEEPSATEAAIDLEMTSVQLARGLSLLALNAEPVVEYGLWVKRRFRGSVMPVGYSNGIVGYLPTACQVDEGGYEAEESAPYFGLPSAFDRSLEARIKRSIAAFTEEDES